MKRLLIVALAACGSDGARSVDAAIDVARPDALIDAPAPPPNAHRYVIDHELLPANNNEARLYGLDLNGDSTVDNQLGMVIATLAGMGLDPQPPLTHAIDTGATIMLADVDATTLTSGTATFAIYKGANPMPAPCTGVTDVLCRHHLAGTATFDIATDSPHDVPLTGAIGSGVLDVGPGTLHLPTNFLGAGVTLQLIGARVRLSQPTDAQVMTGIVAGGVTTTEIDATLIPAMQTAISAQIALDCHALTSPPQCGCTDGTTGKTFIGLFDANQDCAVTTTEIRMNSLINSLLMPDITIGSQQALSFGVGITAVHAAFVPPT